MRAILALCLAACGSAACPRDLPATCPSPAPSYKTSVAPIIEKTCANCHVAGGVAASWPLSSYADVFSLHGACLDQIYGCRMPQAPYSLSDAERVTVLGWLVCEAPDN
jgi:hypothetical protein